MHDHTVDLIVYHGAMHGFDSERPPHAYAGHMVGQDSAAAKEAIARTRAFFQDRLATP